MDSLPTATDDVPARPAWFKRHGVENRSDDAPERWSVLWLADRDVMVCLVLGTALLILLVVDWGTNRGWSREEIRIERPARGAYAYRVNLNTASWVEFAQLDGIGPALGRRIVDDRRTRGRFGTVDELDRVKGIGPKTLARLRPHLRVTPPTTRRGRIWRAR